MSATKLIFFGDSLTDNGNGPANGITLGYPYWQNRLSNDRTYAEYVPRLLGVSDPNVINLALNGARAAGSVAPASLRNLASQVNSFVTSLGPNKAAPGTEASINIGTNDYITFPVFSSPAAISAKITEVISAISASAMQLAGTGVEKIYLYTLPGMAATPMSLTVTPDFTARSVAIIEAHNAALKDLASLLSTSGVSSRIVDVYRLVQEFMADKETFGFNHVQDPLTDIFYLIEKDFPQQDTYAFFDGGSIHPTRANHKVQAAFAAATMSSDNVTLSDLGDNVVQGKSGGNLIFTGKGSDTVTGSAAMDTIFSGQGIDVISAGTGNDVVAGGGGDDVLNGEQGSDVVAGNRGNDIVRGNDGDDILIAGGGRDRLEGGIGNDRLVFDEAQGIVAGGLAHGGGGTDVLTLHVSKATFQSAGFADLMNAISTELATYSSIRSLNVMGIKVSSVERVEVTVDEYVPAVDHIEAVVKFSAGVAAPNYGSVGAGLYLQADMWGLL
jgi:Ca2+-binding RTX toxin-like protein